jgi:predicted dehydrogenase
MTHRRSFLKGAAVAAPLILSSPRLGRAASSNRINVGFIGTGNQGMGLLKRFLAADLGNVVAVCDVNEGSLGYKEPNDYYGREPAKTLVDAESAKKNKSGQGGSCKAYSDYRKLLQQEDLDAVFIVVPDHWHKLITLEAAAAGKDIYCEKPMTFTVAEGKPIIEAVRNRKLVFQTGSHERSNAVSAFVCETVKAGKIGKIQRVVTKIGYNNKESPAPGWAQMPVPKNFDYRMWLGPAPDAPYHQDRCLYRFRFNYDYSGGQITNFGAHCNDMAHWGLGIDTGAPIEVECLDAKFLAPGSLFTTALESRVRCKYANGVELICESGPEQVQTRFEGTEGWLQTGYKGTTASDLELLNGLPEKGKGTQDPHSMHMANFIECVKSRLEPSAPVEIGHASSVLCHIANAMIRLFPQSGPGRVAKWDATREQFVGDDEANKMLLREQRDPWT